MQERQGEEEETDNLEEEEEEIGGVARLLNILTIETAGTEEEAAEGLAPALETEVEEERGSEGEEEGAGSQKALGDL